MSLQLYWEQSPAGALAVLAHGDPASAQRFLFVPPFAEDMNRCRHLNGLISRQLAAAGACALQFDLPGTGDSPLPFHLARLDVWLAAVRHMRDHAAAGQPLTLVGVRFGAALALAAGGDADVVGLAPVTSGAAALRSYLRSARPAGQTAAATPSDVMAGGYHFSAALQADLAALEMPTPARQLVVRPGPVPWLQVEPTDSTDLATHLAAQLLANAP